MRRPNFIAEQARHAHGLLGRLIAFIMSRETWRENIDAIDLLDVQPDDHVLDIGCGHGRSLSALAARAPKGRVAGIDPSELMVELAVERNRALVKAYLVDVAQASAADMPFPDGAFDKALCVHVVYFWKNIAIACRELARVIKPGGSLALAFRTSANEAAVRAFPNDVYRFPELDEVLEALDEAGFAVRRDLSQLRNEGHGPVHVLAIRKSTRVYPIAA